jgi:hypothetical protein
MTARKSGRNGPSAVRRSGKFAPRNRPLMEPSQRPSARNRCCSHPPLEPHHPALGISEANPVQLLEPHSGTPRSRRTAALGPLPTGLLGSIDVSPSRPSRASDSQITRTNEKRPRQRTLPRGPVSDPRGHWRPDHPPQRRRKQTPLTRRSHAIARLSRSPTWSGHPMHDGGGERSHTVEAMRSSIPWLTRQGYEMAAIPSCSGPSRPRRRAAPSTRRNRRGSAEPSGPRGELQRDVVGIGTAAPPSFP